MCAAKASRREFLTGKAALDAAAAAAKQTLDEVTSEIVDHRETYLLQYSRRAMACQFEVFVNAGQYPQANEAAIAALDRVDQLEQQLSSYRESSEISAINRAAQVGSVSVEPFLFDLLLRAQELSLATRGAFDITAGPLSRVWGFRDRRGRLPDYAEIEAALASVGSDLLNFDKQAATLKFSRANVEINLGAIGKGYALDRMEVQLISQQVDDFLLHGGNSSVLAKGSAGNARQGPAGWEVGLRHPYRPEVRLGVATLKDRALATSGSGTQFFEHHGVRYGHIIDPRVGWPAQGVLSTTAIAPSAAEADALSTAMYVLGPDGARQFCEQHSDYGCLMTCPTERSGEYLVHLFGTARDEVRLLQ